MICVNRRLGFFNLRPRQRGQMAIFIALIFQVLFVLFAMAINVALIVHDKINLQNAVDLAAYYAAQRQAEMLNVIAHQNYQIRQSFKLLAWRYRALGSSGPIDANAHPWRDGSMAEVQHQILPSICVTHATNWSQVDRQESLCREPLTYIPPMPIVPMIFPSGLNAFVAAFSVRMASVAANSCDRLGSYNWWFGMAILQAFREDQRNRKQVIYAVANNLSAGKNGDFIDLDGNSVHEGAAKTFDKNLTFSNSQSLVDFKIMNSLEGKPREEWLNEVKIVPTVIYVDPQPGAGCVGTNRIVNLLPQRGGRQAIIDLQATALDAWRDKDFLIGTDYQYSIGVEKNPWYMAYVGVQAQTAPRQIFFPFGDAVQLTARAFAKPFGGRIGPWYGSRWPQSAKKSTGPLTDPLLPPLGEGFSPDPLQNQRRLPNYSRFPGDKLGLMSKLAINGVPARGETVPFYAYQNIWVSMGPGQPNDPMAYVAGDPLPPKMRFFELAAIAPDLFDATYYSIDPNFGTNYLPRLKAIASRIGVPSTTPVRGDLGQNPAYNNGGFSVDHQINIHKVANSPVPLQDSQAFFFIRDKMNLLTGWTTGEILYDYDSFPLDRFGKCLITDDGFKPEYKVPGSCAARGGRTGYSVRLVSRDYLLSGGHQIGGQGESPGPIKNQPPAGW
jgi:hypothetical protein